MQLPDILRCILQLLFSKALRQNPSLFHLREQSNITHILNLEMDIFQAFGSHLIEHMKEIVIIGSGCKTLVLTSDAKSYRNGNLFSASIV